MLKLKTSSTAQAPKKENKKVDQPKVEKKPIINDEEQDADLLVVKKQTKPKQATTTITNEWAKQIEQTPIANKDAELPIPQITNKAPPIKTLNSAQQKAQVFELNDEECPTIDALENPQARKPKPQAPKPKEPEPQVTSGIVFSTNNTGLFTNSKGAAQPPIQTNQQQVTPVKQLNQGPISFTNSAKQGQPPIQTSPQAPVAQQAPQVPTQSVKTERPAPSIALTRGPGVVQNPTPEIGIKFADTIEFTNTKAKTQQQAPAVQQVQQQVQQQKVAEPEPPKKEIKFDQPTFTNSRASQKEAPVVGDQEDDDGWQTVEAKAPKKR